MLAVKRFTKFSLCVLPMSLFWPRFLHNQHPFFLLDHTDRWVDEDSTPAEVDPRHVPGEGTAARLDCSRRGRGRGGCSAVRDSRLFPADIRLEEVDERRRCTRAGWLFWAALSFAGPLLQGTSAVIFWMEITFHSRPRPDGFLGLVGEYVSFCALEV